jgi:hypothetical protein
MFRAVYPERSERAQHDICLSALYDFSQTSLKRIIPSGTGS